MQKMTNLQKIWILEFKTQENYVHNYAFQAILSDLKNEVKPSDTICASYFWKTSWFKWYFQGVLHPRPILWLFMHFSQKLQHIGDK